MDTSRRRSLIIAGVIAASAVAAIVVAVAVVALVRADHDELGTDAHHVHAEPSESAEGAATAAVRQIFTWRPAEQDGPWDALHTAATNDVVTGVLADAAAERPADEPLPRQWPGWAASDDVVVAATELTSEPADPASQEVVVHLVLRQIVQHTDGSATPLPEMTVAVDMVRDGPIWRAAEYRFQT